MPGLDDLAKGFDRAARRVEGRMDNAMRGAALDMVRSLAQATPIETGRAVYHWRVLEPGRAAPPILSRDFGRRSTLGRSVSRASKGPFIAAVVAQARLFLASKRGIARRGVDVANAVRRPWGMQQTAHYLRYLDAGGSRQASAGFIFSTARQSWARSRRRFSNFIDLSVTGSSPFSDRIRF